MLPAFCGPFNVNRIPESDRGDKQIWPAGPVAPARERLVSDFPAPVDAYGPRQGVVGFSLLSPAVTRRLSNRRRYESLLDLWDSKTAG